MSGSPNAAIDKAVTKLLKECDGEIAVENESGIKVKAEVLKVAMAWEKLKHGIREKADEGTEWSPPDGS